MISANTAVYLLVSGEANERVLHPGTVVGLPSADAMVISFDQPVAPSVGSDVNLFFDQRGKFFQQYGTIAAVSSDDAGQTIICKRSGDAVPADSRGCYRVSVVAMSITARVCGERDCPVVNISAEGLAVLTELGHELGDNVDLTFEYDDQRVIGVACVQTVRILPGRKYRCGLMVPSTEKVMRNSLQKITAIVQRKQLQNLRRIA